MSKSANPFDEFKKPEDFKFGNYIRNATLQKRFPNCNFRTAEQVCEDLDVNFARLAQMISDLEILAVRYDGDWYFPDFQFVNGRGSIISGLSKVLKSFPEHLSVDAQIRWLSSPSLELNGYKPIVILEMGYVESVCQSANCLTIL